jgi:UDP-2-acetamido-2,6-beta-L-arabino-hexul-4-ose reductase
MRVLITGAHGFLGKNLILHLAERKDVQVFCFTRSDSVAKLSDFLQNVDFVFHLAGVNRPQDPLEFSLSGASLTSALCQAVIDIVQATGKHVPIIFTSSTQAESDNPYGKSKLAAEKVLQAAALSHGIPVHIFRLPNVFGKWCKPNYNSVVATFCHNISRDLPIQVNDPAALLTLVYVEDVIERFIQLMDGIYSCERSDGFASIEPQYTISVGELARQIQAFKDSRNTLVTERVGNGLVRALYSTYLSYLPVESFAYTVPQFSDSRGDFAEMIKTPDCGQISFLTVYPGATRGGHYHHSKTEKFLIIRGQARFKFRHMQTGQTYELVTSGEKSEIVETVPGWAHDITNIGSNEVIAILWANEVFDHVRLDTFAYEL